jgi:hypothetical protein
LNSTVSKEEPVFDGNRISPDYFAISRNAIRKDREKSRRETHNRGKNLFNEMGCID